MVGRFSVLGFLHLFYALPSYIEIVQAKLGGSMDFIIAGLIGCAVLVYLTFALFNPEKF